MCEIAPSSGPLSGGIVQVTRRDLSALNAKSSDFGHDHHAARVDASSLGVEKGLCEFFGWKVLACVTDRPQHCGSKNSF